MKPTRRPFFVSLAAGILVTTLTLGFPAWLMVGCKTNTEQTVQTAASVSQDAVDTALKVWSASWAKRQQAAVAISDSDTLTKLAAEQNTVQQALSSYQTAFRIAITSWVASKDALGTNAAPTAAALAGFSTAFASASTNLVNILNSHP